MHAAMHAAQAPRASMEVFFRGRPGLGGAGPAARGVNLVVSGLAAKTETAELKEIFAGFGQIVSAATLKSSGGRVGFVEFSCLEEAMLAVQELDGYQGLEVGLAL